MVLDGILKDETIIKCDRNKLKDILGISINALKLIEKRGKSRI